MCPVFSVFYQFFCKVASRSGKNNRKMHMSTEYTSSACLLLLSCTPPESCQSSLLYRLLIFSVDFVCTLHHPKIYRVAQKSKLLTQYNSLLFLSHPVCAAVLCIVLEIVSACLRHQSKSALLNIKTTRFSLSFITYDFSSVGFVCINVSISVLRVCVCVFFRFMFISCFLFYHRVGCIFICLFNPAVKLDYSH